MWRRDRYRNDACLITTSKMYEDTVNSAFDPKIRVYFDDAVARGILVVDDGFITSDVKGGQMPLMGLYESSDKNASVSERKAAPIKEYMRLKKN
ncbi:MAG: hypothetical protein K5657_10155 [Desulfovibrio sp.]|nr:hypothetical protein [Desulfovibrio sp.]